MITTIRQIETTPRYLIQNARNAIRDVYDVIVELATNADDRYQLLGVSGDIEIDIERHRGSEPSKLRIRDFADGMTAEVMDEKLSRLGVRVSGMEEGQDVRGTNARGAKDVAALGHVTFQSIAQDDQFHQCEITEFMGFKLLPSKRVTRAIRNKIGILRGTGTLVTIKVAHSKSIPQHEKLCEQLSKLVRMRTILSDPKRTLIVRDIGRNRKNRIVAPKIEGVVRVNETFEVPGYPGAQVKLVIKRAKKPLEREKERFRLNGIVIKSRRAVHEATLFDSTLENDPHALRFFGKLLCPYIDHLMNSFDDCIEDQKPADPSNPVPVIDPSRKSGLDRQHPFVRALFDQARTRLRPLVEEERQLQEKERATIENRRTRKRLDALEKAATKFMQDFADYDRDSDERRTGGRFRQQGYSLSPPFAQMIVGHPQQFWLNIRQEVFPEFEVGASVQIECLSPEIVSDNFSSLEPHPLQEGVLRATWKVRAVAATSATGLRVRAGSISAQSIIEVLSSEADKYRHIFEFCFAKKQYKVTTTSKRKKVRILAPVSMISSPVMVQLECSDRHFKIPSETLLRPEPHLGVAVATFQVKADGAAQANAKIIARLNGHEALTKISSVKPPGADLQIKLEDIDHKNQRYRWRQNLLEIAAKHPSLKRYLGRKEDGFPGQDSKHFRLLLAEIVADAVCAQLLGRNIQDNPEEFEEADWDLYYAEYSKYMTEFLPIAHKLQCPEGG